MGFFKLFTSFMEEVEVNDWAPSLHTIIVKLNLNYFFIGTSFSQFMGFGCFQSGQFRQ